MAKEAEGKLREIYRKPAKTEVVFEEQLAPEDSGKYALAKTLFPRNNIEDYLDKTPITH